MMDPQKEGQLTLNTMKTISFTKKQEEEERHLV